MGWENFQSFECGLYHTIHSKQHALERRVLYITYINPPEMSCRLDFLPVPCKWGWSPSPGTCSSRGDKNKTIILCYSRVNNTQKIISDRKCWDYSNVCCAFDVVCCVFGREDFVFMRGALVVMKTMRTGDAHLSWHKHTHISNTAFNCWTWFVYEWRWTASQREYIYAVHWESPNNRPRNWGG